jgi:hypothetical protein
VAEIHLVAQVVLCVAVGEVEAGRGQVLDRLRDDENVLGLDLGDAESTNARNGPRIRIAAMSVA